jgi:NADPH-dependent 2,4-dienoyl-CoA reductase/sulfur reductase-like enzyme
MPGGRRGPVSKALRELTAMRLRVGRERRVSLDEAVEITGTLSRRRFLQAGGVAGAGLLLGGCTSSGPRSSPLTSPIGGTANEPRIAIVGAGLAGLAAAYWLTRAGVRVSVYEARDRIGGRCWSAPGFNGGQVAEHGGAFVDTRHVHIATLAEELGLKLDDLWGTWISGSRWPTYVDGQIVRSGDLFEPLDEAAREIVRVA